jgi:cytochrome P450
LNSLAAHNEVLQTHCYSTIKPTLFSRLIYEIAGAGLVGAEGDVHKMQRRLLNGIAPHTMTFVFGASSGLTQTAALRVSPWVSRVS